MQPGYAVLIAMGLLLLLMVLKMPIAFCLGISGLVGMIMLEGIKQAVVTVGPVPFDRFILYSLSVLPMFMLMGQLAYGSGLSERAFDVGNKFLGRFPGGLCIGTVVAGAIFGAACGSTVASAAALGKVAIPEMRKLNYEMKLATGTVACAGLIAALIPPSLGFVIYGCVTGESIGKLLISGIGPGVLTTIVFSLLILIMCIKNPSLAPRGPKTGWKERLVSLTGVLWILTLFITVMGSIYAGFATPTEAAAGGAFASLIVCIFMILKGQSTWEKVWESFIVTINVSAMIFIMIAGAWIFSLFLGRAGLPQFISNFILDLQIPRLTVLIIVLLIYVPLGMFLEPASMMLITLPILYPIVVQTLGYNGVFFGVLVIKMVEIGLLTPPVGMNVYVVKGITDDATLEDVFKGITPFLMSEILILTILITFPQISLWLPDMMMK
jgi:C4-dicarboxylate transporter DctM subunit